MLHKVILSAALFVSVLALTAAPAIRQPSKPAWSIDLTDSCRRENKLLLSETLDRTRRSRSDDAGKIFNYSLQFSAPERPAPYGLLLEMDNACVVEAVTANGQKLSPANHLKPYWLGTERIFLLPPGKEYRVQFRIRHLTQLYPNAFGRITLRPAALNDVLSLELISGKKDSIRVINSGFLPQTATLKAVSTDFFGVHLTEDKTEFTIDPQSSKVVAVKNNTDCWKTEYSLTAQNGERSWSYNNYPRPDRWFTARQETLPLNNVWETAPGDGSTVRGGIPETGWSKAKRFPLLLNHKKEKSHFFWVRTRVTVPENWQGKELYLGVPMVHFKADIFINGKEIGALHLWDTPAKFSLTDHVKAGETFELTLCLTDYISTLLPEAVIPQPGVYDAPARTLTAAVGHFPAGGVPGLKGIPELLAEPFIRTDRAVIRTYVSGDKRVETLLTFRNNSEKEGDFRFLIQILKAGKKLAEFPEETINLKAGKSRDIQRVYHWTPPVLWTPETPELYELRVTLRDTAGKVVDQRRERFGFREFGINANHFTLNGNPVRFYGFSQTTPKKMTWPAVPQPQTIVRHHFHDDAYYMGGIGHIHIGDELGIFIKGENLSHNAHHGQRFAYQAPVTWERLFSEIKQVSGSVVNSPSLAFWDIGNENNFSAPGEAKKMGDFFSRIEKLDPTRLVTISGAYPLPEGQGVRILDTHGMCALNRDTYYFLNPEKRPETMKKSGRFTRIPHGEDPGNWEKGRYFSPTYDHHKYRKSLLHYDNLPVFFSESMYMHAHLLPGLCGDSNYTRGVFGTFMTQPVLLGRRYMLRFTRKADVAAVLGHVARFHGREISPVAAFSADQRLRFNSDTPLILAYDLYNFTSHPQDLTLQLTLKENGRVLAEQQKTVAMTPYKTVPVKFDFGKFSAVRKDRRFDLLISVTGSTGAFFSDWEELTVYAPLPCRLPADINLSVCDPQGKICSWLSERNVPFRRLSAVTDWKSGDKEYLIIAPDTLTDNSLISALAKELRKGGRILVLEHREVPDLTAASLQTLSYNSVGVYPAFHQESPLYGYITPSDLRFWNTKDGDLVTALRPLKQPTRGAFRLLASGAYADGVKAVSTALADFSVGKGTVRYSQLNLLRSLDTEPAAERVFTLLINNPPKPFSAGNCAVLASESNRRLMKGRAGVVTFAESFASLKLNSLKMLISDGKSLTALSAKEYADLNNYLKRGGKMLVLDAAELTSEQVRRFTGTIVRWEKFALDRARFTSPHPLTQGLTSGDLFWTSGKSGTNRSIRPLNENQPVSPGINDPGHLVPVGKGLIGLTKPGYLTMLPVGKGEVVFSTLRLFDSPVPEAARLLSQFLTASGIHLDPGVRSAAADPDRDARENWQYTPIPLAAFCNRAFKDDPNSKIRGWSAQGSYDDLSAFPVGKQTLRGVLFDIADPDKNGNKGLIALSGTKEIGVLPAQVKDIPVGKKFERIVFLYGSAWGAPQFTFRINYADRKTWIPGAPDPFTELTLRPKLEIDDWYQVESYLNGGSCMARAKVAWTGFSKASKKRNRPVGVFLYEWDNPHPEKVIDTIDIISPGKVGSGQVFVLGITGADRRSMRPLKTLLPKYNAKRLLKQIEWSKYGAVIDRDGSIPLIYRSSDGKPLANIPRWLIQGRVMKNGKNRHRHLEGASARPLKTEFSDYSIRIQYQTSYTTLQQQIKFRETGIDVIWHIRLKKNPPPGVQGSMLIPFGLANAEFPTIVNTNPLLIYWSDGSNGALSFNSEYKWHKGYYGNRKKVIFTPFYNNKFECGAERTLSISVSLP